MREANKNIITMPPSVRLLILLKVYRGPREIMILARHDERCLPEYEWTQHWRGFSESWDASAERSHKN